VRKAAKARKINAIGEERPAAELGAVVWVPVPAADELVFEEVDLEEVVVAEVVVVAALKADDVELPVMEARAEVADDTRDDSEEDAEDAAEEALATPPLRVNGTL